MPEITIFFWIIKMMSTTIGETGADYLNVDWRLGLTGTSVVTGMLLALALFFQIKAKRFVPSLYWVSVLLISVFGTLVTDNLSDKSLGAIAGLNRAVDLVPRFVSAAACRRHGTSDQLQLSGDDWPRA